MRKSRQTWICASNSIWSFVGIATLLGSVGISKIPEASSQLTYAYTGNEIFQEGVTPSLPEGNVTAIVTFNIPSGYSGDVFVTDL
jgi:hypothetical protein